jgi:dienelactone hydrolase
VLVVHEWWGLNDYIKHRTEQLAQMGYVAFAADMYGGARNTRDPKQAQAWMSAAEGAPGLLAARSKAGLDILRRQPQTDRKHLAAIGFCFGGTTVLQLAYSGEPLDGVVTFHGGLVAPDETQAKQIKTSIVILHGAEDGFVKPETIDAVRKSLDGAKVDWYMVSYANAVHAFTNPDADSFHIPGIGYNEKAAKRSWEEMQRFFNEKFTRK